MEKPIKSSIKIIAEKMIVFFQNACKLVHRCLMANVYFGNSKSSAVENSIIFFPYAENTINCGLAGIVSFKGKDKADRSVDIASLEGMAQKMDRFSYTACQKKNYSFDSQYLGGNDLIDSLLQSVRTLKDKDLFYSLFIDEAIQDKLAKIADLLSNIIDTEVKSLSDHMGHIDTKDVDTITQRIENLKDIAWCIHSEIIDNLTKVKDLLSLCPTSPTFSSVSIFKNINAILNSIDRLEVRGRDSAGISLMFILEKTQFKQFEKSIQSGNLYDLSLIHI